MVTTEFIILGGMIIVGLIFLLAAQNFIFGGLVTTQEHMYKAEAEEIVSLVQRTMSEQGKYFYYYREISLSNISVKNGILTYQKNGFKFLFPVPKEVSKTDLVLVASVCVVKKNGNIELLEKCPKCDMDYICTQDECKENCQDCYGPSPVCIGDGFCNKAIGENCENSIDCSCDNGICCPSSPDSDNKGCSNIENIEKGKECWCTSQCENGLDCNPTAPTFTQYRKTCCEPRKGWNGTECVILKCPTANLCPGALMDGGAGDHAWIDSDGDVCCPLSNIDDTSGLICSNKHCCPTDKPKWCEKPVSGDSRCMSESDYNDPNKCKRAKFKLILIPVNYANPSNFRSDAETAANLWISISPFKECPDAVEKILIDTRSCSCPSCIFSHTYACIYPCAQNWGLIPADDSGGKNWRILSIDAANVCAGQLCGYVSGFGDPNAYHQKITWNELVCNPGTPSHELGHTFGLCGTYSCENCDGPVYIGQPTCSQINYPSNDVMKNTRIYHFFEQRGYDYMKFQGLPVPIENYCK